MPPSQSAVPRKLVPLCLALLAACGGDGATVTADAVGQGQQEINFTEDGAHYQLIYEVIA